MKVEVTQLILKPGDRIIVRADQVLTLQDADELTEIVRTRLGLDDDVPVLVLGRGMSLEAAQ